MKAAMRWTAVLLAVVTLALVPAAAQTAISARSGMVHFVEGRVLLDGQPIETRAGQFPEVKEGLTLATEEGRAEVLLSPGVFLRMGENTEFRMISSRLIDTRLEVVRGSVLVEAIEMSKDNHISLIARGATITPQKTGLFRLDADAGLVRVYDGQALIEQGSDRLTLKASRQATLGTVLTAKKFDNKTGDPLYRWGQRRSGYIAMANISGSRSLRDRGGWLSSGWLWNPYFGMFTYVPFRNTLFSPYGFAYWSPRTVTAVFAPPQRRDPSAFGGGGGMGSGYNAALGYNTASRSSGAFSAPVSTGASASSAGQAPAAAASPRTADSASPRGSGGSGRGR